MSKTKSEKEKEFNLVDYFAFCKNNGLKGQPLLQLGLKLKYNFSNNGRLRECQSKYV